jgi:hypothetical protein
VFHCYAAAYFYKESCNGVLRIWLLNGDFYNKDCSHFVTKIPGISLFLKTKLFAKNRIQKHRFILYLDTISNFIA